MVLLKPTLSLTTMWTRAGRGQGSSRRSAHQLEGEQDYSARTEWEVNWSPVAGTYKTIPVTLRTVICKAKETIGGGMGILPPKRKEAKIRARNGTRLP
jgi:hypothetical protein